jgi:anti-sigma factor RsiW
MHKRKFLKLLSYLDGELDSATRTQLEDHLSSCHECRSSLSLLQRAYGIIDIDKKTLVTNPFLSARVWEKLQLENEVLRTPLFPLPKLAFTSIVAAGLALGIVLGSLVGNNNNFSSTAPTTEWDQLADDYFPSETFSLYEQSTTNE